MLGESPCILYYYVDGMSTFIFISYLDESKIGIQRVFIYLIILNYIWLHK